MMYARISTPRATGGHGPTVDPTVERMLADRVRRRDQTAMAEIYDLYGALTYSVLLRLVANPGLAEDLTQEVFMRVWSAVDTFDEQRGGLKRWILTIARHKAFDYWRSPTGQFERLACEFQESAARGEGGLERSILNNDFMRALTAALQQLTERQREVIRLAYFEGRTQSEIARKIHAPLGSVKTWVRSALIALRKLLASTNLAVDL